MSIICPSSVKAQLVHNQPVENVAAQEISDLMQHQITNGLGLLGLLITRVYMTNLFHAAKPCR
jgi:hypothetical protein